MKCLNCLCDRNLKPLLCHYGTLKLDKLIRRIHLLSVNALSLNHQKESLTIGHLPDWQSSNRSPEKNQEMPQ